MRTPKYGYAKIQNIVYQPITKWTYLSDEVRKKFAEGRAEGLAEGRAEGLIEVAKKMLDKGMSANLVAEMTGLSLDKVSSLIQ